MDTNTVIIATVKVHVKEVQIANFVLTFCIVKKIKALMGRKYVKKHKAYYYVNKCVSYNTEEKYNAACAPPTGTSHPDAHPNSYGNCDAKVKKG